MFYYYQELLPLTAFWPFLPRRRNVCDKKFQRYAMPSCGVCLSVRPSVRPSRSWILSNPIIVSSDFFTIG